MKFVKDIGIVLISLYYLFFGAYNVVYARILLTATTLVYCYGTDCFMLMFIKILAVILGVVGIAYILLAILIRFHRVGCYLALAASFFNILLMAAYLLKPGTLPIWLTFILPIRVILDKSLSYSPAQAKDFLSLLGSSLELLLVFVNIGVAVYLFKSLGKGVWGPLETKEEKELEE